ncbi:hypothetical protein B0H15DRAFT_882400 [Mycena belliarum]|uniref:Fungal-type protein kinase domain-containing protein n=1 Tax=Mycena belliarum TaxID=1033014 RepID=A0AAD6U968_9AGAR|nr:hypothetical protein B0H15DRAFT_882400 [Mycena belliae]
MNCSRTPEVPLNSFINSLLWPAPASDAFELLARDGHIVDGCWKQFVHWTYSSDRTHNLVQDFQEIFNAICGASRDLVQRNPAVSLTRAEPTDPSLPSWSQPPGAQFRLLASGPKDPPSFSRAVPWQLATVPPLGFLCDDGDIIWTCHNILREDARRRFTFGITADEDSMRLWFFSRSHEFTTPRFSFIDDARPILQVFTALAFATAEELGYDSSMSCFLDTASVVQYKLSVDGENYITTKMLSDNRADVSCGHVTRVWKAFRADDPARVPVVLKDAWNLVDAVPEGQQLLDLHAQLRALPSPGTPRPPCDYFLTVLAHGFVKTSDGTDDSTADLVQGCKLPTALSRCRSRKHYRIVFKEVGVALESLKTLPDVMRTLSDATHALRLLHQLGLVHRDVSAGNILLVDGVGKLSDLEYMHSFKGQQPPAKVYRTMGTPEFTSAEVAACEYLYRPFIGVDLDDDNLLPPPPFWFNPLHDLESLMWIAVFTVAYLKQDTAIRMKRILDTYFPTPINGPASIARMLAIRSSILRVPPTDPLYAMSKTLDSVRAHILTNHGGFMQEFDPQYFALGASTNSAFGQLHSMVADAYLTAAIESERVCLAPLNTVKRKASCEAPSTSSTPDSCGALAQRPYKKPRRPNISSPPITGSSQGSRRRRVSPVGLIRRSSRIAEKRGNMKGTSPA